MSPESSNMIIPTDASTNYSLPPAELSQTLAADTVILSLPGGKSAIGPLLHGWDFLLLIHSCHVLCKSIVHSLLTHPCRPAHFVHSERVRDTRNTLTVYWLFVLHVGMAELKMVMTHEHEEMISSTSWQRDINVCGIFVVGSTSSAAVDPLSKLGDMAKV